MFDTPLSRRAFLGLGLALPLASCGYEEPHVDDGIVRVTLCTNGTGVFDQGFNELMWKGLKMLEEEDGWKVNYLEAAQIRDAYTNLDKAVDDGAQLVWLGGANPDPILTVADQNVDVKFAMLDGVNETGLDNVVAVMFKSEEGSFIVGYIAARMSKTGKVGFIGGIANDTLLSFMYGYMAGVDYANAERATQVTCTSQWAESFSDASKGKSIARKMIADDIDVIFVAAGGTGVGVIEGCDEEHIWVIGVDMDQSYLAPNTVITSCLKRSDLVVAETSRQFIADEIEGGQTIYVGIAEGAVGIPEHHELIPDDIYNDTMALYALFEAGEMKVPVNKKEYEAYTPEIVI